MPDRPVQTRAPTRSTVQAAKADWSGMSLRVSDMFPLDRSGRIAANATPQRETRQSVPLPSGGGRAPTVAPEQRRAGASPLICQSFARPLPGEVDVDVLPGVLAIHVLLVPQHPRAHERVLDAVHAEVPRIVGRDELGHLAIERIALGPVRQALRL